MSSDTRRKVASSPSSSDPTVLRFGQASLEGLVTDSLGRPLTGATVQVEGAPHEARSGENGAFRIRDLGQGHWALRVNHSTLSTWGYPGTVIEAALQDASATPIEVRLPSLESWARTLCAAHAEPETGHVLGRLVGDVDGPVTESLDTGATVRVEWSERRGVGGTIMLGAETEAGADGTFHVCAVPVGRPLSLSASMPDAAGRMDIVIPPDAGAVTAELPVTNVREGAASGGSTTIGAPRSEVSAWVDSTGFSLRSERALFQAGPEDLAMARPDSLTGLLMRIPRLEVREPISRQTEFWLHPTSNWTRGGDTSESCTLDTYLNGSLVVQRLGGNPWHHQISPRSLSGIEVHEGALAPVGSPDSCGAILLWVERLRDGDDPPFEGRIAGQVHSAEPLPSGGVPVRLVQLGRETRSDADGRFEFDAVPPASYTLEVSLPDRGAWRLEVDVRAGATTTATLSSGDPR